MNPFKILRRSNFGALWLLVWLSLAGWFGFGRQLQREHPATAHAAPSARSLETTIIKLESVAKRPRIEAVAISEMRVGDQVPAENPTAEKDFEFGDTVDPPTWRKIVLLASKGDGSTADVELLRPIDWLDDLQATVGGTIELELAELGIEGPAKVLAIEPCPPIQHNRAFRIVTGTFKHHAGKIIELHLDGVDEPIGTTPNHPFWSVDRQAFINASDLQPNEQLLGFDGLIRVHKLVELSESEPVFNLEVQCDHVYHVGKNGVLVHNSCVETFYRAMSRQHYDDLLRTGRLSATAETFISPTQAFAANYRGVVVEFRISRGTTAALAEIGVRDTSRLASSLHPSMPVVGGGWTQTKAYFKREGRQVNIGLGNGSALELFNNSIISFGMVP